MNPIEPVPINSKIEEAASQLGMSPSEVAQRVAIGHAARDCKPGETVEDRIMAAMSHLGRAPSALRIFEKAGLRDKLATPAGRLECVEAINRLLQQQRLTQPCEGYFSLPGQPEEPILPKLNLLESGAVQMPNPPSRQARRRMEREARKASRYASAPLEIGTPRRTNVL